MAQAYSTFSGRQTRSLYDGLFKIGEGYIEIELIEGETLGKVACGQSGKVESLARPKITPNKPSLWVKQALPPLYRPDEAKRALSCSNERKCQADGGARTDSLLFPPNRGFHPCHFEVWITALTTDPQIK